MRCASAAQGQSHEAAGRGAIHQRMRLWAGPTTRWEKNGGGHCLHARKTCCATQQAV